LASLRGERTLVISSHNLAELELICDYIVILEKGQCIKEGPTSVVTGKSQVVEWTLGVDAFDPGDLNARLEGHDFRFQRGILTQLAATTEDLDASSIQIALTLAGLGIPIREVRRGKSLERAVLGDGAQSAPK